MSLNVAIACGGTGGHVMPGLATAEALRARGHTVTLWMTGKDVETKSVEHWNGDIVRVASRGLPTRFSLKGFGAAWHIWSAARECKRRMRDKRPDVLLAMGSYASAGPVMAARRLRVPYVLHEANVIPGRAVRFLARGATALACHFDETQYYMKGRRCQVTGMPLRNTLDPDRTEPLKDWLDDDLFTIIIAGGSAGAHVLNEMATEALGVLARRGRRFRVIHLTGVADERWVRDRYEESNVPAWVRAFTNDVAPLYQAADLAICRAGASTCAELALFGLPALMVPYPYAANDHQTANARALEKAGAVDVVPESDLSATWLFDYVDECLRNTTRLIRMSDAFKSRQPGRGAERLADLVEHCAVSSEPTQADG